MLKLGILLLLCWHCLEVFGNCKYFTSEYKPRYRRIRCSNALSTTMFQNMGRIVREENLSENRINLEMSEIQFTNGVKILQKNWFMVDVFLQSLLVANTKINDIEDDAFNSLKFEWLVQLEFRDVPIRMLHENTFAGLKNLESLYFKWVKFVSFSKNVFATVPKMKKLVISDCGSKKLVLDNLFSSNDMPNLQILHIGYCNLGDTITELTFKSLSGILNLSLGQNEIQHIGERSFDVVLNTVKYLYLKWNNIKSIDGNLFKKNRHSIIVININDNAWHCDCKLEPFRQFIQSAKNIEIDDIICASPLKYAGVILNNSSSICVEPDPSETSMYLSYDALKNNLISQCVNSNITLTKDETKILASIKNDRLMIDALNFSSDLNLIVFMETERKNGKIITKCLTNISDKTNDLRFERDLKSNQFYRFCSKKKESKTVSPLNCVSFYSINSSNSVGVMQSEVWIKTDDKAFLITILVLCPIFAFIIGVSTSLLLAKWFSWKFQAKNARPMVEKALSEQEYESVKRLRLSDKPLQRRFESNKWNRPINQMSSHMAAFSDFDKTDSYAYGYITLGDIPPPLPPRTKLQAIELTKCCNSEDCQCYCDLF